MWASFFDELTKLGIAEAIKATVDTGRQVAPVAKPAPIKNVAVTPMPASRQATPKPTKPSSPASTWGIKK